MVNFMLFYSNLKKNHKVAFIFLILLSKLAFESHCQDEVISPTAEREDAGLVSAAQVAKPNQEPRSQSESSVSRQAAATQHRPGDREELPD